MGSYVNKVMELLNLEFGRLMAKDEAYYKNYKIYLSNEQQYVKEKDRQKGAIYIVVKLQQASLNFGQTILPITINAIAERNKIEVCQKLLLEFAQTYNLTMSDDETIKQTYTAPAVGSNFNEVFDGFRSLFMMSGTFLISENANPMSIIYNDSELDCITVGANFDIALDTQPFASDNFTKSIGQYGTLSINITTYLTDTEFVNKALSIATKQDNTGVNEDFTFMLKFKNGYTLTATFKLSNMSFQQNIGEIPVVSMTFTN